MKKIFLSLVLSLFLVPLAANAANLEVVSVPANPSNPGVVSGFGSTTASGTHTGINNSFSDEWLISYTSGATLDIATSGGFSSLDILYSLNGSAFASASSFLVANGNGFNLGPVVIGDFSPLRLILNGAGSNSSYSVNLNNGAVAPAPGNVPVPAAVWLFGSALMGLVGVSRRKKA